MRPDPSRAPSPGRLQRVVHAHVDFGDGPRNLWVCVAGYFLFGVATRLLVGQLVATVHAVGALLSELSRS